MFYYRTDGGVFEPHAKVGACSFIACPIPPELGNLAALVQLGLGGKPPKWHQVYVLMKSP